MYNYIQTIQVDQANFLINDLFYNSFKVYPPEEPKHFILFVKGNKGEFYPIGYTHFSYYKNVYLGGGMCIDKYLLRKLPKAALLELKQAGGIAYFMLNSAVNQLNDCVAIFGYVGNPMAERVDYSVGFKKTEFQHLIVYWKQQLSSEQQQDVIDSVAKIGPF